MKVSKYEIKTIIKDSRIFEQAIRLGDWTVVKHFSRANVYPKQLCYIGKDILIRSGHPHTGDIELHCYINSSFVSIEDIQFDYNNLDKCLRKIKTLVMFS